MIEQSMTYREVEGDYPVAIRELTDEDLLNIDIYQTHWHDGLQVCYIQEGRMKFCIDGKIIDGKAGDLITVTPNSIHYIEAEKEGNKSKTRVFSCFFIRNFLNGLSPTMIPIILRMKTAQHRKT